MARVTVEDCLENVENRFQLVLIATKRAREIARGKQPIVPWDNDKPTVVALREIAAGYIKDGVVQDTRVQPESSEAENTQEGQLQSEEKPEEKPGSLFTTGQLRSQEND